MLKKIKKIAYIVLMAALVLTMFSCKPKRRHKWVEVGSDPNPPKIAPGVHPERGSDSDAVPIILVPVTFPLGRDSEGKPQYKKYFYELEELTPDSVDVALKSVGVIDQESLFCDLVINEIHGDNLPNAGPGAVGETLNKIGTVRYVDLSTSLDNSDKYEGKYYPKDLEGLIDQRDIEYCITQTFEENFQLVSCTIEPVGMDEYNKIHGK